MAIYFSPAQYAASIYFLFLHAHRATTRSNTILMYSRLLTIMVLSVIMLPQFHASAQDDWADIGRYAQANSEVTVQPKAVFMGDSITQCWWDADQDFFTSNNFLCRGISGQTTSHMLVRMRKDVVDLHPKYVVILAGTNDIAKNNGFIEVDDIYGNIVSMCEIAKANRIKPVICSVLPVKQYKWRPEVTDCADRIIRLNSMLEEYASRNRFTYVDYHSAMKDPENGLPEKWSYDGVHLNGDGYDVIEAMILKVLK